MQPIASSGTRLASAMRRKESAWARSTVGSLPPLGTPRGLERDSVPGPDNLSRTVEFALTCLTAFAASALTFFSGFGLGTILTPVFAVFFPIETAVAATAVIHLANNVFKLALIGTRADWRVVLRFSSTAAVAALIGALLLVHL